jgi:hypothetical protein
VKASGCHCNIHFEIWVANAFDSWWKYKKLNISLSIVKLHASKPKLLVNYLFRFFATMTHPQVPY